MVFEKLHQEIKIHNRSDQSFCCACVNTETRLQYGKLCFSRVIIEEALIISLLLAAARIASGLLLELN